MTLSRRGLLGALAAGSAGGLTGRGAVALLGDRESTTNALTTGVVDIVVDYWGDIGDDAPDLSAPDSTTDGADAEIRVGGLEPGASIRDLLRVRLPQGGPAVNNPARVWLGSECPSETLLGELLSVRLSYAEATGTRGETIVSGSLRDVAGTLRNGVPLAGGPATDEEGCLRDALFLLAEYELGGYVGSENVSLPLAVAAVQCRNTDAALSPFSLNETGSCEPGGCCCWAIGKVDIDEETPNGAFEAGESYSFTEGLANHSLAVTDIDGESGAAFTLVRDDGLPAPPLCRVDVKGGPDDPMEYDEPTEFGVSTDVFPGAVDGLVYAPFNTNSGARYGISYVFVSVCAPEDDCPVDIVANARSGDRGGNR